MMLKFMFKKNSISYLLKLFTFHITTCSIYGQVLVDSQTESSTNGQVFQNDTSIKTKSFSPPNNNPFIKNEVKLEHLFGARWELEFEGAINVYFTIEILDISQISLTNSDFRLDLNMKIRWTEESLAVPDGLFLDSESEDTKISAEGDVLEDLWAPDLFIPNARISQIDTLLSDLKSVYIFKNKTIIYVFNMFTVLGCPMDFHWYPKDTQNCKLILESYSFGDDKVNFAWEEVPEPVQISKGFKLMQYALQFPLNITSGSINRFGREETYSRLVVNFVFKREIGHHLIQVFIPTFLIVSLSWFSFWLGIDAIPGRVSLIVTCMLTLVTMNSGLKADLPALSYIKMLDIWMAGCLMFVFAAMSEFIIVRYLAHENKAKKNKNTNRKHFEKKINKKELKGPKNRPFPYNEFYGQKNDNIEKNNLNQKFESKFLTSRIGNNEIIPRKTYAWDSSPFSIPHENKYDEKNSFGSNYFNESSGSNFNENKERNNFHGFKKWENIDRASRVAFPLLFASFLAVYCPILIYGSK